MYCTTRTKELTFANFLPVDIALTHGVFCLDLPDPSGAHVRHERLRTHTLTHAHTHTHTWPIWSACARRNSQLQRTAKHCCCNTTATHCNTAACIDLPDPSGVQVSVCVSVYVCVCICVSVCVCVCMQERQTEIWRFWSDMEWRSGDLDLGIRKGFLTTACLNLKSLGKISRSSCL